MPALNIFLNPDGHIAWLNLVILIVLPIAGWLFGRSQGRQKEAALKGETDDARLKQKNAETELKSYKSSHEARFSQQEKTVEEMTNRARSLEGDIKAMAEEKQKLLHTIQDKEGELKGYSRQSAEMDDRMKSLQEEWDKQKEEMEARLQSTRNDLTKALAWEKRTLKAEEEAQQARRAFNDIQRKTLEFDLRLKAASEYAAKVQPLEQALQEAEEKFRSLETEKDSASGATVDLEARLAEATNSRTTLQAEYDQLKQTLKKKEDEIADLMKQATEWKTVESMVAAGEQEIKLLRQTNAGLQQELAERSGRIKELEDQLRTGQAEENQPTPGALGAGDNDKLIKEDLPGQGEES